MKKNNTPQATPAASPEKMTLEEIDRLARALAFDLMDEDETISKIVLLLNEIAVHPFDHSYIETIAHLVKRQLYAATLESDRAETKYIARQKAAMAKGGA
jgi:hypothetical protein